MASLYDYCKQNGKEYLLQEWDYELNKNINPQTIRAYSHKKGWWKCSKCGYKWETKVINRTHQHTGCPACAGSILLVGKNDLATKYPEIANELLRLIVLKVSLTIKTSCLFMHLLMPKFIRIKLWRHDLLCVRIICRGVFYVTKHL